MAYQATNSTKNTGTASTYSDICVFAAEIVRERTNYGLRLQAEASRKRLLHRQELQDAREAAAAETLVSLKRSSAKVCPLSINFRSTGLIFAFPG